MFADNNYYDILVPPPADPVQPAAPLKEGPYEFDASGLRIKGFAEATPQEIMAEIHSQYDGLPKQYGGARFVAARRKSKQFFQAHLMWYGVKFPPNAGIRDLEVYLAREMLREAPVPQISTEVRAIEADMQERYESSSPPMLREAEPCPELPETNTLDLALSQEVYIECDANSFLTDPEGFPGLYFGTDTPSTRVVVLQRLPDAYRQFADEMLCHKHGLKSVHMPRPGCRAQHYDIVLSRAGSALAAKVLELGSSQRGRGRHG
ncbi:hypothetical protein DACRYDRAFT_25337 [Dacryopinax primogenitus]|uniref:Uncharacterized protein n=1 Tax=Dacryopinax primogenitus (strain DJM 731) TaxID=1858805 RepID=M5FZD8_DACPD|nr:uncharacterized protein DACRYDRAFT_25337 [Dacryopinax primogenitus]EJT96867.1 hypothetical protein DACRYDRAFT_25337 [Dacryopinax primogenitus]